MAKKFRDLTATTLSADAQRRAAARTAAMLATVDPLAAAITRGPRQKEQLLTRAGGVFTSAQVAKLLGISHQAVDERRISNTLLAVPIGAGDYDYPKCQFTANGVVPGLIEVLRAFQVIGPWTRLAALLEPADALGGQSILNALNTGDIEAAITTARGVGEQGA